MKQIRRNSRNFDFVLNNIQTAKVIGGGDARLLTQGEKMTNYLEIAQKYTPENVTVKYRKSLTGVARFTTATMEAPEPKTRASLYIYLHECAHFHLDHWNSKRPVYVQEYEAEQWATKTMRAEGIAVPKKMLDRAKSYVLHKIGKAKRRGLKKVDPKIKRFVANKES